MAKKEATPAKGGRRAGSAARTQKKARKNIGQAVVHVHATFNNTIVTITDPAGNTISWASAGAAGFTGSRKSTPFAAGQAAERAAKAAMEHGVHSATIEINGPGSGRDSAVRQLQAAGIRVISIRDITPVPHNGCRAPKRRRV
ncbi:MAG: 30S ribosomal protein S11 [Candidatus Sumerlaeia bacterium]|nr:30S ribosomal protein S11 [Candidatus Sumerlaeia bacterium]